MLKPTLQLKLGQSLTMTPQLQQAIQLLQLPVLDLSAQIQDALESNVMLEMEDLPDVPKTTSDTTAEIATLKAEDIMSPAPVTVEETTTAEEVAKHMIAHNILRVPVVRDDRILGIISRTDLLHRFTDNHVVNIYGG